MQVLGSGGPEMRGRASASYLVWVDGKAHPSATEFLAGLFGATSGVFRYLGPAGNEMAFDFEPHDVALQAPASQPIHDKEGLRISATPVIHAKVPALAFLVEAKGKKIAFSGDGNGNNGNLQKLAAGADMLVAHLAIDDSFHFGERSLHAPPALIGEIAAEARSGQLVLAHRRPETLGKEAALQAEIARAYKGPVAFADDLSCFVLN